jgi:CRISPR/Cas system-associated endoribonuclease Cas2
VLATGSQRVCVTSSCIGFGIAVSSFGSERWFLLQAPFIRVKSCVYFCNSFYPLASKPRNLLRLLLKRRSRAWNPATLYLYALLLWDWLQTSIFVCAVIVRLAADIDICMRCYCEIGCRHRYFYALLLWDWLQTSIFVCAVIVRLAADIDICMRCYCEIGCRHRYLYALLLLDWLQTSIFVCAVIVRLAADIDICMRCYFEIGCRHRYLYVLLLWDWLQTSIFAAYVIITTLWPPRYRILSLNEPGYLSWFSD